ncbi:hypothetical protein B0T20DRAFT_437246 [Sordaria brevicollis]|uniref:ATP-dependent RNA helicase DHX8 n=1 Tax=Sordaria brevicollis TaxID=83679 RepID=A0AAE0PEF5_SORBR|nr:hypothetical protein B0T20DRAFT_437246 [Sordaria brevicollis]
MAFLNLPPKPPTRQIRALQSESVDDDGTTQRQTITVYQAYPSSIAIPAITHQRLDASPDFRTTRMTWIKPSWAWMLYRSGYSYKDPGQERILAIEMKREDFLGLLGRGILTHGTTATGGGGAAGEATSNDAQGGARTSMEERDRKAAARESKRKDRLQSLDVKIQWDPERTVRLDTLNYRSIQIGIPAGLIKEWAQSMIVSIEDVTDRARELKRILDERPDVTEEELAELGLLPEETEVEVPIELRSRLGMSVNHHGLVSRTSV